MSSIVGSVRQKSRMMSIKIRTAYVKTVLRVCAWVNNGFRKELQ